MRATLLALALSVLLLPTGLGASTAGFGNRPLPNLLVLRADDVGKAMLSSVYGTPDWARTPYTPATTPNLDTLASEGLVVANSYSAPACGPSRVEFWTGRDCELAGDCSNTATSISTAIVTLADVAKYNDPNLVVWGDGKLSMGSGSEPSTLPGDFGYDEFTGRLSALGAYEVADMNDFVSGRTPDEAVVDTYPDDTYLPDQIVANWKARIDAWRSGGRLHRWVSMVEIFLPHHGSTPLDFFMHDPDTSVAPWESCPLSTDFDCMREMVHRVDADVGEILAYLTPEERAQTCVVFLSDNGGEEWSGTSEPIYSGHGKGTVFESGVDTGAVISCPGMHHNSLGQTIGAAIDMTDLHVTLLEMIGATSSPPGYAPDGASIADLLRSDCSGGACDTGPRSHIFTSFGHDRAAVTEAKTWKIVHNQNTGASSLYDLGSDPGEQTDLCAADCEVTTGGNETACQGVADALSTFYSLTALDCAS